MDKLRWIINTVLFLILIDLIFFGYIYIDKNYPEETQALHVNYWVNKAEILPQNLSYESNLMDPNMRFNHNDISFNINSDCNQERRTKILESFLILSNDTQILSFYPNGEQDSDIKISCSESRMELSKDELIAGEGGPTIINNTLYPLITSGQVYLYSTINCKAPIVELHEILHVFGFTHVSDPKNIMYPYLDCSQVLDEKIIQTLKEIYSEQPKADLSFTKVSANKKGRYMDIDVEVDNRGIIKAEGVLFNLYVGDKKIDSYDLNDIDYGAGKTIYLTNIQLPLTNSGQILLNVTSSTSEYNYNNNFVELSAK